MTFLRLSLALVTASLPLYAQVSPAINRSPSRGFGQSKLTAGAQTGSPNLTEGRELSSPSAIAFDRTSNPPIVYVADSANHRVLAWRNPAALTKGNQADRVIGQRDFTATFEGGPGAPQPSLTAPGLRIPSGLAVDSNGDLWVLDAGNNRILRFARPLEQQGEFVSPNLVIGQKTPSAGIQSNQGLPKPTEKTLSFNRGGGAAGSKIVFDGQGNLWVTDTLNHRVLRFPKARLTANEPAADLVLGQLGFDTDDSTSTITSLSGLSQPVGLAVDDRGGVYVADNPSLFPRVVYYDAPTSGGPASRLLGLEPTATPGQPRPPAPNDYTLGRNGNQGSVVQCLFTLGTVLFVCDNAANRVVRYASPESWPAITNAALSPPIAAVYGQNTLFEGGINRGAGASKPGNNTLFLPRDGAFFNNEMWLVDFGNHRVLAFTQAGALDFPTATRLVGQLEYDLNAPNLVDGRELFVGGSAYRGSAVAVDRRSSPNRLYVADSLNNRVLAFRDVRTVGTDSRTLLTKPADLVIGQADRFHTGPNYPTYDTLVPTDQGLFTPSGVAVDAAGNLWVADSNNGRVLRFPDPFSLPAGTVPRANLVLGQSDFSNRITDPSSTTMSAPVGVATFNNGDIAVSDLNHHRVLLFRKSGADFVNGQAARTVLGQQNFSSITPTSNAAGLNRPRGIAVDTSDRLYVADSGNNRVIVYSSTATTPNGATGTSIPNLNSPEGVAISVNSGEVWVAAAGDQQIYRFLEFTQLGTNPTPTATLSSAVPIAIALDGFDNIIAVEAVNRVTFFYAQLAYRHAATYASSANIGPTLTPNMYTLAARLGKNFDFTPTQAVPPYPKVLDGIQVLVNGTPAPITSVTGPAIYFLVPNSAPTSGVVEYLVTRPATGEILAAGNFFMGPAAPGFFTANQAGTGQVAACNESPNPECSVNSATNPIGQDQVLTLWLTGFGYLPNAPPDGEAAGRAIETEFKPTINIGAYTVPPDKILYSGLSPQFPGLWQLNIRMPKNGEPGAPLPGARVPIILRMIDIPSNIGGTTATNGFPGPDQLLQVTGNGLVTTIAIK